MLISNSQYSIDIQKSHAYDFLAITFKGDHEKNDDSLSYRFGEKAIFTIADGLGSASMSHIGSTKATKLVVEKYCESDFDIYELLQSWKEELSDKSLSEYETTLKVIEIVEGQLLITSVGDGGVLYQTDNNGYNKVYDNLDFVNETNTLLSITTQNVVSSISTKFEKEVQVLMFTDGIELIIDENEFEGFTSTLNDMFSNYNEEEIAKKILEWVDSWLDKNVYDDATMIFCTYRR